jgi:hypothetical protein
MCFSLSGHPPHGGVPVTQYDGDGAVNDAPGRKVVFFWFMKRE